MTAPALWDRLTLSLRAATDVPRGAQWVVVGGQMHGQVRGHSPVIPHPWLREHQRALLTVNGRTFRVLLGPSCTAGDAVMALVDATYPSVAEHQETP